MSSRYYLILLLVAAVLEAGGDALVRTGLHSNLFVRRAGFLLVGGIVLFSYGIVVNLPSWDFGRLLGAYIAIFFLIAQLINYLSFGQKPTISIIVGGTLIVGGGLVIAFCKI